EEIDVVSIGDKNLPTNPTERDYRHLQSEVASKIRTASSRGAQNGSHHHHLPYQRHQHHLADGQGSGNHHLGGIYPTPAGSTTISGANTPLPTGSGGVSAASSPPPACTTAVPSSNNSSGVSRKRPIGGNTSGGSGNSSAKRSSNSSKRMRMSHSKRGSDGTGSSRSSSRNDSAAVQAHAEELDTVEKRNLHNNLERQRRIGLKNLFEELKRQIPQLRDKERAPKVNILREAATLCTRLNQEAEQVNELRQRQMKLYERVRYLRASIHNQRLGVD
uniref:BHLH domain-containing protein n=1 Tax=Anopheles christyi TaxID=43041 RepID=A0A182KAZ8_9DIPT